MSRTSPSAAPAASILRRSSRNASSDGASSAKSSPAAREHGRRRGRPRSLEHLERVQHGRRPDPEDGVTEPLLGHIQRHLGVEHAHVELEQPVHVLRQEGHVVNAVHELHGLLPVRWRRESQGGDEFAA
jgi:hypothetical protein